MIKTVWDDFWKKRGHKMEWNQKTILRSKELKKIAELLATHFNKKNLKGLRLLELGAGMGITSLYFAREGAKVTLLDLSPEVKTLAQNYWKNYATHSFIQGDLFTYNPKSTYDIVSSFGLCEHFVGKKREKVLKRHIELLGNRGIALISVPYKYGLFYRLTKLVAELSGLWSFGLEVPFSKKEMIEFAHHHNLKYTFIMGGFYSSAYDLFIRKPLKILGISTRRKFDERKSWLDWYLGSGLVVIFEKKIEDYQSNKYNKRGL